MCVTVINKLKLQKLINIINFKYKKTIFINLFI